MTFLIFLLLIILTAGIGYIAWHLFRNSSSPLLAKRTPAPATVPDRPTAPAPVDTTRIDPVITPAPTMLSVTGQRDTVGDYIRHFNWKGYSWDEVVFETYRRVLKRPHLASYFHSVKDLNTLQKHFTGLIKVVTMDGIRTEAYANLAAKHACVRDRRGRPITGKAYDEVIDILKTVLAEKGVPQVGIDSLGPVVTQLRRAIVVEPA